MLLKDASEDLTGFCALSKSYTDARMLNWNVIDLAIERDVTKAGYPGSGFTMFPNSAFCSPQFITYQSEALQAVAQT